MNRNSYWETAACLALAWYVLSIPWAASAADLPWDSLQITNQTGRLSRPFVQDDRMATVLVFVAPDCPISNQYAPLLQRLQKRFNPRGVKFYLVYPDRTISSGTVRAHLKEYGYEMTALLDSRHDLVERTGVKVTPEAVVLGSGGQRFYRGRIDNRHVDFGKKRAQASRHDLELVLEALSKGQKVDPVETKAVGCYIDREKSAD